VSGLPGGVSKFITEEERETLVALAEGSVAFSEFTLQVFHDIVLKNKSYVDMITDPRWALRTYYMGLVNDKNQPDYYDGDVRVVGPDGKEFLKFKPKDYLKHIAEHVEPYSYCKYTYLKAIGWKASSTGPTRASTASRPSAASTSPTACRRPRPEPLEGDALHPGRRPCPHDLATHWARLIELLNASETLEALVQDKSIVSRDIRAPIGRPGEGVGIVEAARGTLIHHYVLDEQGMMKDANLIVATTNNHAAISLSIRNAAKAVIHKGDVSDGTLNTVEMAFRAYDPCFGCATHALPGELPLEVHLRGADGSVMGTLARDGLRRHPKEG